MKHLFRRLRRPRHFSLSGHPFAASARSSRHRSTASRWHHFEPLEPRLMLEAHNGPHSADPSYNLNSNFHIHADLSIFVNSALITIPQEIGVGIHTHDNTGVIHIHPGPQTEYVSLADVFESWRNFPQPGSPANITLSDTQLFDNVVDNEHTLQMYVNGVRVRKDYADYQIHDLDDIVLIYTANPVVVVNTNLDDILTGTIPMKDPVLDQPVRGGLPIELRQDAAPGTVNNFLNYVNDGVGSPGTELEFAL